MKNSIRKILKEEVRIIKAFNEFVIDVNWKDKHFSKLDEVYNNGGTIYRIIYTLKKTNNINYTKGHYWTYDKSRIFDQINLSMSQTFFDENDVDFCYAHLITAEIPENSFDLNHSKEKSLELESEVFIDKGNFKNIKIKDVELFKVNYGEFELVPIST